MLDHMLQMLPSQCTLSPVLVSKSLGSLCMNLMEGIRFRVKGSLSKNLMDGIRFRVEGSLIKNLMEGIWLRMERSLGNFFWKGVSLRSRVGRSLSQNLMEG